MYINSLLFSNHPTTGESVRSIIMKDANNYQLNIWYKDEERHHAGIVTSTTNVFGDTVLSYSTEDHPEGFSLDDFKAELHHWEFENALFVPEANPTVIDLDWLQRKVVSFQMINSLGKLMEVTLFVKAEEETGEFRSTFPAAFRFSSQHQYVRKVRLEEFKI